MKKILLILLTTIMLLIVVSIPAAATPSDMIGGHWTYLPRGDDFIKESGGNLFLWDVEDAIWKADTENYAGGFEGNSVDTGIVVIHRSGSAYFNGVVEFESVTVMGKTGSMELRVNGTKKDLSPETDWKGYWVISDAGGDLAGLKGQGTWWGPGWQGDPEVWGHIDYEGKIHFEPSK